YTYSRDDVDSQALANQYAQMLGQIFTHETKPLEVEILVAAVGYSREGDRLFHIRFDGSVTDETGFAVLGGEADPIRERLGASFADDLDAGRAVRGAVAALAGDDRALGSDELEVAILQRLDRGRCFRRLENGEIAEMLA
ncbi:MAG: proteasome subunit alpha, partial [Acidimicrobiia bacterium]|nr:proteasome subunit alpha [Acidimicrobiia bacterium]